MKTAKLGAMFLISILALAGIGVGYAAWTDTLTITGTVNTGDVDINVVDYSGTWVYKNLDTDLEVIDHDWVTNAIHDQTVDGVVVKCTRELPYMLVAYAYSGQTDAVDDAITVTYGNLFPCIDFKVDYLFHYDGSIPSKIQVTDPEFTGANEVFFDNLIWTLPDGTGENSYCYGEMWVSDVYGSKYASIADLEGYQLHKCDYILLEITLHLAQDNNLMNMGASFTAEIEVVQWNEYPYIP